MFQILATIVFLYSLLIFAYQNGDLEFLDSEAFPEVNTYLYKLEKVLLDDQSAYCSNAIVRQSRRR
ncbi:hypothetical protein [Candidatus Uabimicrobium sp. HlEnr_7]|uniref:hypothetical protein n=1 Tax=Candidatus Uabimicrobium helgolandensis TaxID=3095367 RepID=UPI00355823AA